MHTRVIAVLFAVLLVGSVPATVVGASAGVEPSTAVDDAIGDEAMAVSTGSGGTAAPAVASSPTLHRSMTLRHLPDRPGTFEAELTLRIPDAVTELELKLPAEATVESTADLEATDDGAAYRWTETTDEPTVRFTMPASPAEDGERTAMAGDSSASEFPNASPSHRPGDDGYTFVDTGDWGIVKVPVVPLSYRHLQSQPVAVEETVRIDGPGATGGDIAFFGPVTEHERVVDDGAGTIRLAVPDAADLREDPDDILEAIATARDQLDVGATSNDVFFVAAPANGNWGSAGVQYGPDDAWVVADASLSEPANAWLHEYVHVRQRYARSSVGTTTETEWLVEAQADYYAGLLALEQGLIDFAAFRDYLADGERSPYDDGALANPDTWDSAETNYVKGRLVAGDLDRRLRLATDGDRTLEDVFRQVNARDEPVTETAFLGALEDEAGEKLRATAEEYTRTAATPEMWGRDAHRTAFDQPVAEFSYGVAADGIEVAGEPWEVWHAETATDGRDRVIAVPVAEPVRVPTTIDNVGTQTGTYDATLQVDGETVDYARGTLEAGTETTARLTWTPAKPGTYELRVGSERMTAVVGGPSSVRVTELTLEPESVAPGEPVTATATVEATGDGPGAAILSVRTPDEIVEVPVAVAAGDRTTIEQDLRFDSPGRNEVAVGEQSAIVTVGAAGDDSPAPAELEEVPGFGALPALAALAALLVIGAVRVGRTGRRS